MAYKVEFDFRAEDDLAALDRTVAQQVLRKLKWLSENSQFIEHKSLHQNFSTKCKLRIGDYRAIYSLNQRSQIIRIHFIGHRSKIYKV